MRSVTVIGCGRMGRRRLDALRAVAQARLVSVCDADEEAARAAEKEYGVPSRRDWQAALDDGADAVLVCAPNFLHAPTAIEALRRGQHVFCEKPLATTVGDARAMVLAALASRGTLTVGANIRLFPNVAEAFRLFREGAVGELLSARVWIGHDGWNLATPWYRDARSVGGGTLIDNGIHALDLLRLFMGELVDCAGMVDTARWTALALGRAEFSPPGPAPEENGRALEDNAMGLFRSAAGRLGTLHSSWTERGGYLQLEVNGAEGFLRLACRGGGATLELAGTDGKTTLRDFSSLPPTSCRDEMAAYCAALEAARRPRPTGYDGLRAVQSAHALYDSARSGERVDLWTDGDRELRERVRSWEASSGSPGSTATSTRAAAPSA